MPYIVQYLVAGTIVACSPPLVGSEKHAIEVARDGLIRHRADCARVLDRAGLEIELVLPNA